MPDLHGTGRTLTAFFDTFVDMGGNLIDTAHVYSDWVGPERARSERVVGDWLERSRKRSRVVLVTKGGHPDMTVENPDPHISRMKKADMVSDLDSSLRQLRTDYIDLYFYHRDDTAQSVGELIEVMEEFRRQGKIRCYGCSNWTTRRMREADRCTSNARGKENNQRTGKSAGNMDGNVSEKFNEVGGAQCSDSFPKA